MTDHLDTITRLGEQLATARQGERDAVAALKVAIINANADGVSESAAARAARINRRTVRSFLGKKG